MRKLVLVLVMFIASIQMSTAQVSLTQARSMYMGMKDNKCNSLELSKKFENSQPKDALLKAYWGASTAAAPECLGNPMEKIKYFRKGKELLDESAKQQPTNVEVRFLRFATQTKAPSFLGYKGNIQEDKIIILKNIAEYSKTQSNKEMAGHIASFMLDSGELSTNEKMSLKQFSSK